jgi:transcriptional regulator with XRE-family HTH domain
VTRTRDYAKVIRNKIAADTDLAATIESECFNADIAMTVYEARIEAGLTQKELADRAGTHQSVISRIEDADYNGHSITLLKRISHALGKSLRVEFYAHAVFSGTKVTSKFSPEWPIQCDWQLTARQLVTAVGSI